MASVLNDKTKSASGVGAGFSLSQPHLPSDSLRITRNVNVAKRLSVYVQGALCLDRHVLIHATLPEFTAAWRSGDEKLRFRWEELGSTVGGSVAHWIRCLGPKASRICLGAVLPESPPSEVSELIDEHDVDTRFVTWADQSLSESLNLSFLDGAHRLIVSAGTDAYGIIPPPDSFSMDAMLINPGPPECRRPILRALREQTTDSNRETSIGLVARGDWDQADFCLVRDTGCRLFLNSKELDMIVSRVLRRKARCLDNTGRFGCRIRQIFHALFAWKTDPRRNMRYLADLTDGSVAMTVTLGRAGSLTLNGGRYLTKVTAANVENKSCVGAGDSFASTVLLSSAQRVPDDHSCVRGSMEAGRVISGKCPARSFAELDDDASKHPEIAATRIAM